MVYIFNVYNVSLENVRMNILPLIRKVCLALIYQSLFVTYLIRGVVASNPSRIFTIKESYVAEFGTYV